MNEKSRFVNKIFSFIYPVFIVSLGVLFGFITQPSWSYQVTRADYQSIQLTWDYESSWDTTILTSIWENQWDNKNTVWDWQTKQGVGVKNVNVWWKNQSNKDETKHINAPTKEAMEYSVDSVGFWISKEIWDIQVLVGKEYWINPKYLTLVGMVENIYSPWKVWDNWCSYGIYQFNKCPGNRASQVWFWKKFLECAKDYECSTRMVAEKIRSAYKCDVVDWVITNYTCLYKHQWVVPSTRYKNLVDEKYSLLFQSK